MSLFRRIRAESLIPPLAALAIFAQACTYGWVYIDDPAYYVSNPLLGEASLPARLLAAWTVAPEANWMPLTWTVAIIADSIPGAGSTAIHLFSVAIHVFSAWLAWLAIRRLGADAWLAAACACAWALHPLRAESVAWASSLKHGLSGCFSLGMLAILAKERKDWRNDWPAFLLFVASLLSKQVMIAFPAALFLWDQRKTDLRWHTLIMARLKWWIAGFCAALVTLAVNLREIGLREAGGYDSPGSGVFRGLASFGHQFLQLWAPMEFSPEYLIESATVAKAVTGAIVMVAALAALAALLRKRGGVSAWCFVASVGLFFPLAGWTPSPMEFTADRLSHMPHFFAIAAVGLALKDHRFAAPGIALFAMVTAVITFIHLPVWKNGDSLNEHMLRKRPGHPTALENRGAARAGRGDAAGAIGDFLAVSRSHPQRASAWANAVRAIAAGGDIQRASAVLDEALSIHPNRAELRHLRRAMDGIRHPE